MVTANETDTAPVKREWTLINSKDLRKQREALGLSRKTLSQQLGVSPGAVQNWEAGTSTPSTEVQERIIAALKGQPVPPPAKSEDAPKKRRGRPPKAKPEGSAAPAKAPRAQRGRPAKVSNEAVATIVAALIAAGKVSSPEEVKAAVETTRLAF